MTVEVPRAGRRLRLHVLLLLLLRELGEEVDDPEPPREDDEGLNEGDGRGQHLELGREVSHAQQDGQEEHQLEDPEDDEPRKEEEPDPSGHPDHQDDGGEDEEQLEDARDQDVELKIGQTCTI